MLDIPMPLSRADFERNVQSLYPRMPKVNEGGQAAYSELFAKFNEFKRIEGMAESGILDENGVTRPETTSHTPFTHFDYRTPGSVMPAAELLLYHAVYPKQNLVHRTDVVVPTLEVMLRGITPDFGHTEMGFCRFSIRSPDPDEPRQIVTLYTLYVPGIHGTPKGEGVIHPTDFLEAYLDKVSPAFMDFLQSLRTVI